MPASVTTVWLPPPYARYQIEVQVAVDDCDDIALVDADCGKGAVDRDDVRVIQVVDESAPDPDAGVEEDDAIGVTDDVSEHRATALGEPWMPCRKNHFSEEHPLDPSIG
jgi:hypothetical protein